MPKPNPYKQKSPYKKKNVKQQPNVKSQISTIDAELSIDNLSHDGRGIGRIDGKTVFVSGALPGEIVKARVTQQKRRFDEGHLLEVIQTSPHRVQAKCEYHGQCGGCVLQHLEVSEQVHYKQQHLLNSLERIAGVSAPELLPAILGPSWNYRRKARLSTSYDKRNKTLEIGFRQKESASIVPIKHCDILAEPFSTNIDDIGKLLNSLEKPQAISHLELAQADNVNALVLRQVKELSEADYEKLQTYSESKQLQIYLLGDEKDELEPLGDNYQPLNTRYAELDITYEFSPTNFVQVNASVNKKTIEQVLKFLDPQPDDVVLDLFCGIGNFSLPISRQVKNLVGIEGSTQLIQQARHNAEINHCNNVSFFTADLCQDLRHESWLRNAAFNKVLLDPPRSGAIEIMPLLGKLACKKIVYVSCDPATLARDAAELCNKYKYKIRQAGVMDMFPHTGHVESMVVFERK